MGVAKILRGFSLRFDRAAPLRYTAASRACVSHLTSSGRPGRGSAMSARKAMPSAASSRLNVRPGVSQTRSASSTRSSQLTLLSAPWVSARVGRSRVPDSMR